jgi:hypothetical protein
MVTRTHHRAQIEIANCISWTSPRQSGLKLRVIIILNERYNLNPSLKCLHRGLPKQQGQTPLLLVTVQLSLTVAAYRPDGRNKLTGSYSESKRLPDVRLRLASDRESCRQYWYGSDDLDTKNQ